jgi:hypothetical protein
MEQYISKSAVVAEIENLLKPVKQRLERDKDNPWDSDIEIYKFSDKLIKIINTLDVKEVDEELQGIEKEVAEGYVARIDRKRIPIKLKGEIKAKFKNEFHTIWQTVNEMQFANVAEYIIERICLHFATWGAYYLKDYIGMSNEEKSKMDSMQEEPYVMNKPGKFTTTTK